jgi:hypothetical protein
MATAEIQLTHQEQHALHALAQRTGKTPDTLLHEAVMQLLSQAQHEDQLRLLQQARGMWKDRTNLPNVAALRAEFDWPYTEQHRDG